MSNSEVVPRIFRKMGCYDWFERGDYIWFCHSEYGYIYKVNKKTGKSYVVAKYPDEELCEEQLSVLTMHCGRFIVFAPYNSNYIAVVNYEDDSCLFLQLDQKEKEFCKKQKFWTGTTLEKKVIMFGLHCSGILILDMEDFKTEYISCKHLIDKKGFPNRYVTLFRAKAHLMGNGEVILPLSEGNKLLKYDLNSKTQSVIEFGKNIGFIHGASVIEDKDLYIVYSCEDGINLERICINNGELILPGTKIKIKNNNQDLFYPPLFYSGHVVLIPIMGEKIYIIDSSDYSIGEYKIPLELIKEQNKNEYTILAYKQHDQKITMLTGGERKWVSFDIVSGKYDLINCHFDGNDYLNPKWEQHMNNIKKECGTRVLLEEAYSLLAYLQVIIDQTV